MSRLLEYAKQLRNGKLLGIGPALTLAVIFITAIVSLTFYLARYPNQVSEMAATEDAQIYTRALSSFRLLYTRLIVEPARLRGTEITHDVTRTAHALLLPATMTRLIGEHMATSGEGGEALLYSPYPFPSRKNEGGLRDSFQGEAWEFLTRNPLKPFARFESLGGIRTLRFATADIMHPSCVKCHNEHPQSPLRGWKVGDVRGILEVRRPVENVTILAKNNAQNIFFIVAAVGLVGILGFLGMLKLNKNLKVENAARKNAETVILDQQTKLITSSKMSALGEMAGGIAHEINNPLAIIKNISSQLQEIIDEDSIDNKPILKDMTDHIDQTVDRMAKIIQGLRAFSRDGSMDQARKVSVQSIVMDTLVLCEHRYQGAGIELTVEEIPLDLTVCCRAVEISQAMLNLLNNSADAIADSEEKWIRVAARETADEVEISIADSGKGVPVEVLGKIFQPFFTTKEIGKGTGLGLSVSLGLITHNHGRLVVDESSANTKFCIFLPKVLA